LLFGVGLALPLALVAWLVHRLQIGVAPLPEVALSYRRALILATQSALYQETVLRLAVLPLTVWGVSVVTRLRQESGWPLLAGVAAATLLGGVFFPGEGALLAALFGLAAGYVFVQAGWEAAVLLHFFWMLVPLLRLVS
jgi:hypothetical protein